jgi:hypothetical protein
MWSVEYLPRSSHRRTSCEYLSTGTETLNLGIVAPMENWRQAGISDNLANRFFNRRDWIYITVLFLSEDIKRGRINLLA